MMEKKDHGGEKNMYIYHGGEKHHDGEGQTKNFMMEKMK